MLTAFIAQVISSYLTQLGVTNTIKWPNDVYVGNNKLAGILIENKIQGNRWHYAVAGIGLNLNTAPSPNSVCLQSITGITYDVVTVAHALLQQILLHYDDFVTNPTNSVTYVNNVLYKKNELVTLKQGNKTFKIIITKVLPTGHLACGQHSEYTFAVGEIKWILP